MDDEPVPAPGKSVNQMVKEYEDNIILPPPEFRDGYKPVAKPGTRKSIVKKTVPAPRIITTTKKKTDKALNGYTQSFEITLKNNKDPLIQLQSSIKGLERYLKT